MDWTTVAEIATAILLAEAVLALVRHLAGLQAQTPSEHLDAGASTAADAAGWGIGARP